MTAFVIAGAGCRENSHRNKTRQGADEATGVNAMISDIASRKNCARVKAKPGFAPAYRHHSTTREEKLRDQEQKQDYRH